MATITINGKTRAIDVNILYFLVNHGAHAMEHSSMTDDDCTKADELTMFIIEAVNGRPTYYHVESPNSQQGHYVDSHTWNNGWAQTICGKHDDGGFLRVDMPPGGDAPTPSKPMCPECQAIHDAIEGWRDG